MKGETFSYYSTNTKRKVQQIMSDMELLFKAHGCVTVDDVRCLLELKTSDEFRSIGWDSLDDIYLYRGDDMPVGLWRINFPDPKPLLYKADEPWVLCRGIIRAFIGDTIQIKSPDGSFDYTGVITEINDCLVRIKDNGFNYTINVNGDYEIYLLERKSDRYKMPPERFQELLDELDGNSLQTLKEKNARYSQNGDCLHNFRSGAEIAGGTPAQACWGYLTKHLVALRDMVDKNDFSNREDFLEKCQDTINYIRFLWCIGNDTEREEELYQSATEAMEHFNPNDGVENHVTLNQTRKPCIYETYLFMGHPSCNCGLTINECIGYTNCCSYIPEKTNK